MSGLDSELNRARIRLAELEEQKRIESETASHKKTFPLNAFESIVDLYRGVRSGYNDKFQRERWRKAQEKLGFLEPILDVLKNIQERLDALEKKE